MRETSILIKPASASCNCVCTYCFYDDVSNCRTVKSHGLIKDTTWQALVDGAYQSDLKFDRINFLFQGGEPMIAGYKFFKEFVDYTQTYKGQTEVTYAIQTNGTKMTDKFCQLFLDYNFLVGISVDGFKENHNLNRFLYDNGSFDAVMEGVAMLRKYKIPFNVLTVLTKKLARDPERLYQFYTDEGFDFVQLIPCLPSLGKNPEDDLYACTPELYGSFFKAYFDLWLADYKRGKYMSESLIDNVVTLLMGGPPGRCGMLGACQLQCIVEANGSIYPCDFFVLDEYELGNINNTSYDSIMQNQKACDFLNEPQEKSSLCESCRFVSICNGNCKRLRPTFLNDATCGYRDFLEKAVGAMPEILQALPLHRQS